MIYKEDWVSSSARGTSSCRCAKNAHFLTLNIGGLHLTVERFPRRAATTIGTLASLGAAAWGLLGH